MKRYRFLFIILIITTALALLAALGNVAASVPAALAKTAATIPQIDLNGNNPGIDFQTLYTENIGLLSIVDTTALTLTDTDNIYLASATITLLNRPSGGAEQLKIDTSGTSLVANYNSNTGILSLTAPSGQDTLTNFQKVLRTICYLNNSDDPTAIARAVQFVISDGGTQSPPATATINMQPINDAPLLNNSKPLHLSDIVEDEPNNVGNLVAELLNSQGTPAVDDTDGPLEGIAIVAANNGNGKWQYKTTNSWIDIGNVTEQTAVLLDPSAHIRFQPASQFSGSATLNFRAWDQSDARPNGSTGVNTSSNGSSTPFSSNIAQATITVAPQNDAPIIDLNGPEAGTKYQTAFTEDSGNTPIVNDTQLTVSDVDSPQLSQALVKLTNLPDGNQEALAALVTLPEIHTTYNTNAGELRLQGPATPAQFQQVLRSVVYNNLSQNPNNTDRIVEFTVSDGISVSTKAISTIAINRVNDAPVLNVTNPVTLTPIDEDDINSLGNLITNIVATGGPNPITDADGDAFRGIAIIGVDNSNGRWQYRLNGTTAWLDFTAVSSISATLLSSDERIRYLPDTNYSGAASFTFRAWDRSGNNPIGATNINTNINGGTSPYSAAQANATITINSINDAPILDLNGLASGQDFTADFNEGLGAIAIVSPTLTLQDVDNVNIQSAQIEISNLLDPSQEILNVSSTAGLTVSYNPASGSLTISGPASTAQYETILRTTTYNNLSLAPNDTANRLITFSVTDDGGTSNAPVTSTVRINPVNNVPIINSFTITGTEDTPLPFSLSLFNQHFADPDGDMLTELKISTLPANGTLLLAGVPLAIGQPIPAAQIGQLRLVPLPNWNGSTSLAWNGKDNEVYPANGGTVTIIMLPSNDPPTLDNVGKEGAEDERLWFTTADFATRFNDIDDDNLITVQVTSLPARGTLRFGETAVSINETFAANTLSQLSFTPEKDWNGIISFDWNGSDGQLSAELVASAIMTITAVNDPPTLTPVNKFGSEDNTLTFTLADFNSGYSDIEGDTLQTIEITSLPANGTLHLGGNPVTVGQEINATALSTLTFIPATDWFGSTSFGWNGSDGQFYASSNSQVAVTITAVNDPPKLDLNGGEPGTSYNAAFLPASGTIRIVSRNLTLTDIDSDELISVTITLQDRPDGDLEFLTADTSDTNIHLAYDEDNGILKLTGSDTTANYQKLLRTVSYRNDSTNPTITNRAVTFIASDGTNSSEIAHSNIIPPYQTYLPLTPKQFRRSDEPNNNCRQAFPLNANRDYQFLPNDQEDWYQFTIPTAGAVTIELTNFAPQGDGQLIAYAGTCPNNLTLLGQNGDHSTTKMLNLGTKPAGTYFIRVFNGSAPNTKDLYRLRIRY